LESQNRTDQLQVFPNQYVPLAAVNSGQFDWDLSFTDPNWSAAAFATFGLDAVADPKGIKYLQNTTASTGWITYQESSMFPTLGVSISAQVGPGTGTLQAYVSLDGVTWSQAVPFTIANDVSSYQLYADLSSVASGLYKYFIKIELDGAVQVHKIRISPVVQTSKFLFPRLTPGTVNSISYTDASPVGQGRATDITAMVPTGKSLIRGVTAISLVPESPTYSLSRDFAAANLVDGNPESIAYPGSSHLDYQIQLNGPHHVSGLSIDWNRYGMDPSFVKSWTVYRRNGNQPWQAASSGGYPGQATTTVAFDGVATDVRIVADSINWIGIYEVRVYGTTVSPQPVAPTTVRSNVTESQTYSISPGYGAANLIDGSASTAAYPASPKIDYQLGFISPTHLTWMRITWGSFGSKAGYVNNWSVLGRTAADQPWAVLAQGGFPNGLRHSVGCEFYFQLDRRIRGRVWRCAFSRRYRVVKHPGTGRPCRSQSSRPKPFDRGLPGRTGT
jgi:hypothetical protein